MATGGSLVAAGGSLRTLAVYDRILELAGGRDSARIVFVATNSNNYPLQDGGAADLASFLATSGYGDLPNPVVLRHTYDPAVAETPEFWQTFDEATGIFFTGGRPYRSVLAYKNTATQAACERLLARGGVISGSSAGMLMMSNVMLRSDLSGDNEIVLGDLREGMAFGGMVNLAFDVHNLERNRAFDPVEVVAAEDYGGLLLALSADEDTAFSLIGDELQVIGNGFVAIYDPTLWQEINYCGNFRLCVRP
jgi:cyanophycinase-like exopeptidase